MPAVAMIQRPGRIKNATRDILPPRLATTGHLALDRAARYHLRHGAMRSEEDEELANDTNLAFSDWPTVFPNAACTTALIDRVVHHAEIIAIEGESYRRREVQQNRAAKPSRRPKPKD